MEVTGSAGLGNSELEPSGSGVAVSELDVGSTQQRSELDVGSGDVEAPSENQPADETVVPGDFPLPGRDIPRNPRQDAPSEPSPEDIAADTSATGTATGTGAGVIDQPGPELPQPTREIGGGGGGFEAGRDFPSGASAVVGAEVARTEAAEAGNIVEQTEPGLFEEATGTPATDPLAPGGVGVGPAARADDLGFNDFGTGTGTGIGTGTGVGTGTGTATGTGSATQTLLEPVFVTGQAQVNEQAIDEGIANENVFEEANPVETITPPAVSTGPPGRPRRPRRDRDGELNDEGDEFSIGFGGATFESPTQGLGEISEDLAEMFGGDNGP